MPTTQTSSVTGYSTAIGIQQESVMGTAPASSVTPIYLPCTDITLSAKNKLIHRAAIRKSRGNPAPGIGSVDASGNIALEVEPDTVGIVLAGCMGAEAISGAGPYVHTFKLGGPLPTYTVTEDFGLGNVIKYLGMKFNDLSITAKPDGFLELKSTLIGKTAAKVAGTLTGGSFSTAQPFEWAHLGTSGGVTTINGVTTNIKDFTITLKNNLKAHYAAPGGRFLVGIDEMPVTVDFSFGVNLVDYNLNTILWGNASGPAAGQVSAVPVSITFWQSASSIITFNLGNVTVSDADLNAKRSDVVAYTVKGVASESGLGTQDDLSVVLTNSTSTSYLT